MQLSLFPLRTEEKLQLKKTSNMERLGMLFLKSQDTKLKSILNSKKEAASCKSRVR